MVSVRLPIEAGTATEELWAGSCLSCLGPHFSLHPPSSPAREPAAVWTLRQDPQHLAPSPARGFSLVHCLLAPGPLHRGAPETCRQVLNQGPTVEAHPRGWAQATTPPGSLSCLLRTPGWRPLGAPTAPEGASPAGLGARGSHCPHLTSGLRTLRKRWVFSSLFLAHSGLPLRCLIGSRRHLE